MSTNPEFFRDRTQLTIFDRPSSWGSEDSDSPLSANTESPSCYTLSPTTASALSRCGTIPMALAESPLESENSTASSLTRMAWLPLRVPTKDEDNNGEGPRGNDHKSSPPPPMPEWPMGIPGGPERQTVPSQRVTVEVIGDSRKSEFGELDHVSSPEDVEPLPSHAYIPENARRVLQDQRHRHNDIAVAIGSPSQMPYQYQAPEQTLHSEHDTTLTSPAYPAAVEDYYAPTPHPGQDASEMPQNITVINNNVTHVTHHNMVAPAPPAPAPVFAPAPAPRVQSPPPAAITEEWRPPHLSHQHQSLPAQAHAPTQLAPRHSDLSNVHPAHRRSTSASSSTQLLSSHQRTRSFSGKAPTLFKLNPTGEKFPAPPGTGAGTRESFSFVKASLRGGASSDDEDDDDFSEYTGSGKQWKIQIITPLSICLLFLCGLVSAALHHIFYTQLHNTAPSSEYQGWYTRAGIAIALFTTSVWAACVAICYRQRVWTALMQRSVKVNGVDALWGLLSDPSQFLVREAWRKSKLAMLLGIICWLLPLTTVFVPGALFVLPHNFESQQTCLVSSFDPPNAAQENLNVPQAEFDRLVQNKTAKDIALTIERPDSTRLTAFSKRMGTIAAFSGELVEVPLPEGCGLNCSYTISFTAPGYKCETKTADEAREKGPWGQLGFEQLFRSGNKLNETFFYSALADNQTTSAGDGRTISQNDEDRLGMGSFWVAYRHLPQEVTDEQPELLKNPAKAPKNLYVEEVFRCTDFVVEYNNVKFTYTEGKMNVTLPATEEEGKRYIAPVNYANRFQGEEDPASLNRVVHDYTSSILLGNLVIRKTPVRNSTIELDGDKDGLVADIFRTSQLEGTFLMDETRTFGEDFKASSTGVRERFRMPSANLREGIENLHRNITLSFLSEPRLQRTFWSPTTCTTRSNGLIYEYRSLALLTTYGAACFLVIIGMAIGFYSLRVNGFCTDFSFSRILCTTRGNPTLDEVFRGDSCLGHVDEKQGREEIRFGEVLVKATSGKRGGTVRKMRGLGSKLPLGLGTLNEEREQDLESGNGGQPRRVGHASFGLLGEVVGLRRDKGYA